MNRASIPVVALKSRMSLETSKSASERQSRVASARLSRLFPNGADSHYYEIHVVESAAASPRAREPKRITCSGIDLVHDGFDHTPEERVVYLRHGSGLLLKSEKQQTGDAPL